MRVTLFIITLVMFSFSSFAQHSDSIVNIIRQIESLENKMNLLLYKKEQFRLTEVRNELISNALPALKAGEELITHSCMALVYSEEHEQAKWVAHIIVPDVMEGVVGRTNEFREDPKIASGSALEADYFLKTQAADGKWIYDGFGYDRGHLAPSADFRWSETALSESYYYSNMSPQVAEFNRGKWSDLENYMRSYIYNHPESKLYIVTGPILCNELPVIERGVNKVSIPKEYFKVAYDPILQNGIAFIMPNIEPPYPVESYAVSINDVEAKTGLDFFQGLEDELENRVEFISNPAEFIPEIVSGDIEPIYAPSLPANTFNTVQAKLYMDKGESITVCGTVVGAKVTRNGHVFLNLDKQFPNHIFTVTIWKDDLANFSYFPADELIGKKVFVTGKVSDFSGIPSMNIQKEKAIRVE